MEFEKVSKLYEKIANCGVNFNEYIAPDGCLKSLPVYCDNRSCDNPECKKHRLYKYRKSHQAQIDRLNQSMKKPKGWVFTGYKYPLDKFTREFCQSKLLELNKLLKNSSVSEFSIHMEIKVYPKGHSNYGYAYLHFHVVSAGFRDLRYIRSRWKRQIRYEEAINKKALGYYVSKYASKTPVFNCELSRGFYHNLVYKLQMHRFSCSPAGGSPSPSGWYSMDCLISEVKNELKKDWYLNPNAKNKYYYKILESDPPPINEKLDSYAY